MARVLLSGALAGAPDQGGAAWSTLHFLLGLRSLGHDVLLAEPAPSGMAALRAAVRYRREVAAELGLDVSRLLIVNPEEPATTERDHAALAAFATGADVHVNLSGRLRAPALTRRIPVRVYVDLDPGYTQAWAAQGADLGLALHTHFVTIGPGIADRTRAPADEATRWIGMMHPVFLPAWTPSPPPVAPFTTLGHWRSFGTLELDGRRYGPRAHTVRRFLGLPAKAPAGVRAALAIHPGDRRDAEVLRAHGWDLVDPGTVARTPRDFQRFVGSSAGEIGLPKHGYVLWDCGWFSERSAAYLASGRPVVALRTGFERYLPTGSGLLGFADEDGAAASMRTVLAEHDAHARAARALAEEHFDASRLLAGLLETVGR